MATTAPINLNRLLGLDESLNELDPTMLQMLGGPTARGGKPDLDDALNNEYFKRTGIRLAPGQLPEPVPEGEEARQAGKTTLRRAGEWVTGLIPSFGGGAETPVAPTAAPQAPAPVLTPTVPPISLQRPLDEQLKTTVPSAYPSLPDLGRGPLAPTPVTDPLRGTPLAPTATSPIPPASPRGDEPSFLYSTLQKHATFVRDVLEGGGTLISDLATGGFGAALKVSDILNYAVERVASGGPFKKEPDNPTFFRDLLKKSDDIVSNITYTPKSDIAKNVRGATGKVFEVFQDIAALPAKALAYGGHISEDTAAVVGFATELYLFYKLDRGVRDAAPELRSKIANVKEKFSKGTEAEARAAAEDLANAASKNPNLDGAMNEARGKFRDEGEAEGTTRPRGPEPEGPAPAGATINPEELKAWSVDLNEFVEYWRAVNPDASVTQLRTAMESYARDYAPKPRTDAQRFVDDFVADNPGATPEQAMREFERQNAPPAAPEAARPETSTPAEPVRAPTAEAPLRPEDIPPGEMVVRPRVEPEAATAEPPVPEGHVRLYRTDIPAEQRPAATDPSQAHVASTYLDYIRDWRNANAPAADIYYVDVPWNRNDPMTPEPPQYITAQQRTQLKPLPSEAAAVTPPEVSPPSSGELPIAAAVPPQAAPAVPARDPLAEARAAASPPTQRTTVDDVISGRTEPTESVVGRTPRVPTRQEIVNNALGIIRDSSSSPAEIRQVLSIIKREAHLESPEDIIGGLNKLGIDNATIDNLFPEFREARERIRSMPEPTRPAASSEPRVITDFDILPPEAAPTSPARDLLNEGKLAELKSLAREGLRPNQSIRLGLERLGFTPDEVSVLEPQLKKLRAAKLTPAVQTATAEAVLESAPPGTEVEIPPPPAEAVVDTSPAIEKPKRKRKIVKAPPEPSPVAATSAAAEVAATAGVETGAAPASSERIPADLFQYHSIPNINMLQSSASTIPSLPGVTNLPQAPIHLRAKQGAKPDAVFVDTARLNTRTTLADINTQAASGRISADVAEMMKANLQRQADLSGLPITEAHNFTGQELLRDATRIAAETGTDLYVKKGKNYELVPKDVVQMDTRINSGDDLKPIGVSKDSAGAYVESKTSDIGPDTVAKIREAVELGIDISEELPAALLPHYKAMVEQQRAGIDTSERRSDIDIAVDMETIKEELRTPPGERVKGPRLRGVGRGGRGPISNEGGFIDLTPLSDAARMAAQRLQADMRKLGKGVREFLFGARPEDVAVFEKYLERINNPAPPDSTNPANMRFDPENVIPGDRILKQRITEAKLPAPPLWQSEVSALQNAKDIKPGGSVISLKTPYWQHVKADTQFIYHSYRTAQKNVDAAIADLHDGMQELGRGFSTKSLENIGANGYLRQGPDGQRILTYNKMKPTPLTPAEKRLQANLDGIYTDFWIRVNEERVATGREALPPVDDYQTFARTQSLLNHLGMGSNLIMDKAADIMAKYIKHKSTNFPYTQLRKGAVYSAEMNALKILDTYAQSALKEIHLGPFLGKLHELIEYKLPDPVTGKETWLLKDEKPGLYQELSRWKDYLATGSNVPNMPEALRYWLGVSNRNLGYAMLSFGLRSGAVQLSTLRNTYQSLGMVPTVNGLVNHLMDIASGGEKFAFALKHSEVLASRKFIDAYSDTAAAIVGRRPHDFFRAIARGQFGELQAAIGGVGMKILEIPDMQAAVMSWNAAYDQAKGKKMGYSHKDAVRFADDLVVRSQGSTMPGDLAGIQRNAVGKALTQFQTFAISDWNFLTNEVFSTQQGKVSKMGMMVNIIKYAVATQLMNEFYRMLHIQPPGIEFVRDWSKKGSSTWQNLARGASNFLEPIPIFSSTRHGRGVGGPLVETGRDLTRALRDDPMAPSPFEPGAMLLGAPGVRSGSKYIRAKKRGETEIDSLLGWYSEDSGAGRRRPERRARPSR